MVQKVGDMYGKRIPSPTSIGPTQIHVETHTDPARHGHKDLLSGYVRMTFIIGK